MQPTRETYRPSDDSNFVAYRGDLPKGVELYIYADNNSLIAFKGRKVKPVIYSRFSSFQEMINARDRFIAEVNEENIKREQQKSWVHDVKVGDIFRSSWGYEQTNVNYYEVITLVGKTMVTVLEIEKNMLHTNDMQGKCTPIPSSFINDKIMRLKIKGSVKTSPHLKINSFANASRITPVKNASGENVYKADYFSSYY